MRLRIFDWNTPWFWLVCFYRKNDGRHIEFHAYSPQLWQKWWFHFWAWEAMPDTRPQFAKDVPQTADAAAQEASGYPLY
jgi:hypothetical protein